MTEKLVARNLESEKTKVELFKNQYGLVVNTNINNKLLNGFYPFPKITANYNEIGLDIVHRLVFNPDLLLFPTQSDFNSFAAFYSDFEAERQEKYSFNNLHTIGFKHISTKTEVSKVLGKSVILPFFIPSSEFEQENIENLKEKFKGQNVFGTELGKNFYNVSDIIPENNQLSIIESYINLCENNPDLNASLLIWGGTNDNPQYVKDLKSIVNQIEDVNIKNKIRIIAEDNNKKHNVLPNVFGDVFIDISDKATYNTHLYEAMMSGKAVIAKGVRAVKELIPDNGYLYVNEYYAPAKLDKRMEQFVTNPDFIRQAGLANSLSAKRFTEAGFTEELMKLLK